MLYYAFGQLKEKIEKQIIEKAAIKTAKGMGK